MFSSKTAVNSKLVATVTKRMPSKMNPKSKFESSINMPQKISMGIVKGKTTL